MTPFFGIEFGAATLPLNRSTTSEREWSKTQRLAPVGERNKRVKRGPSSFIERVVLPSYRSSR